jgi:hypothetical protein
MLADASRAGVWPERLGPEDLAVAIVDVGDQVHVALATHAIDARAVPLAILGKAAFA